MSEQKEGTEANHQKKRKISDQTAVNPNKRRKLAHKPHRGAPVRGDANVPDRTLPGRKVGKGNDQTGGSKQSIQAGPARARKNTKPRKRFNAKQRPHKPPVAAMLMSKRLNETKQKYERVPPAENRTFGLAGEIEEINKAAVESVAKTEVLLTDHAGYLSVDNPMKKTYQITQEEIKENVDAITAAKMFNLTLDQFGPYQMEFSRNGRFILIGGHKGHVALFDWRKSKLLTELNLAETVRDIKLLHNETMFAVAQKYYLYIYDKDGTELHKLHSHQFPTHLEFLPYHFLLASTGKGGFLKYIDTSTGQFISQVHSTDGQFESLRQNPRNAVLHSGHSTGVVCLWTPTVKAPVVKMLCHHGNVSDVVVDLKGNEMITAGVDGYVKVWDLRTYKSINSHRLHQPVRSLDISQRGFLGASIGSNVTVWRKEFETAFGDPYMSHKVPDGYQVKNIRFCPYEDLLGIGHENGVSQIIVPGTAEPNIDSYEANPFETKKQRRETTVVRLLEKIPPDMIVVGDSQILAPLSDQDKIEIEKELKKKKKAERTASGLTVAEKKSIKKKRARGKTSATKQSAKKQSFVIHRKTEAWDEERVERNQKLQQARQEKKIPPAAPVNALARFKKS